MSNIALELGDKIRKRRELLGLVQSELSAISGISARTIQLVEQGKGNPSLETLIALAVPMGLRLELELNETLKSNV